MKPKMLRVPALLIALLLAACSSERGKQVTSTTAMGAAIGIPGGPIGIAAGAVIGAAAGAILPADMFKATSPSGGAPKQ